MKRIAPRLCEAIALYETHGLHFALTSCGRCEAILMLRGHPSRDITDVDPFYNNAYVARAQPLAESPHPQYAERTAAALNAYLGWVYQQLSQHPLNRERQSRGSVPINFLLTKWAAVRPEVAPFQEQNGLRAASIENYPLYVGIARGVWHDAGFHPVDGRHHGGLQRENCGRQIPSLPRGMSSCMCTPRPRMWLGITKTQLAKCEPLRRSMPRSVRS